MSDNLLAALSILVIAAVTLIIRSLPFVAFGGKKRVPDIVNYLGKYLVPTIIIILVVFCVKDTHFLKYPYGLPELISIVFIVIMQSWRKGTILSVISGTALYMILLRLF